jgi:diaminohydroxyphosphoribosylaminopyrimidine deaminase/5-amino-6-(5-phosphoribosylamino)uracil reductase
MTLDGKMATRTGDSRWISGEQSRAIVHRLRGRVDAIVVGRGTVAADDPLLTARPSGSRTATRIVLDSRASLPLDSRLVRTAAEAPVLVAAASDADERSCRALRERGVEVWQSPAGDFEGRLRDLLQELARRQMTNVLVEGGARVLGCAFDLGMVDEVHAFVAPRVVGGRDLSPVGGAGAPRIADATPMSDLCIERVGEDAYIHGRIRRPLGTNGL